MPGEIRVLVQKLGSEDFQEREAATKRLEELGTVAIEELRAGCKSDNNPYRPRRIGLRPCHLRHRRQRGNARGQMQKCSAGKFHRVSLSMNY